MNRTNGRGWYLALIGDIRGSRELEDRADVQRRFEATLEDLDDVLDEALAARFVVTTGDEFQALFQIPRVVTAMGWIAETLPEVSLAYGIGAGGLDTPLKDEAVGMDGPCFHRARRALNVAKSQDRWAWVAGLDEDHARQLSHILGAIGALRSDWTPKQARYAHAMRTADTQREVANAEGKSPSTVSESLASAHHREVRELEQTTSELLAESFDNARREDDA